MIHYEPKIEDYISTTLLRYNRTLEETQENYDSTNLKILTILYDWINQSNFINLINLNKN